VKLFPTFRCGSHLTHGQYFWMMLAALAFLAFFPAGAPAPHAGQAGQPFPLETAGLLA
jgi:hypothetical protein